MYKLICVETDFNLKGLEPGAIYTIHAIDEDNSLGIKIDNKMYFLDIDNRQLECAASVESKGSIFDIIKEDHVSINNICRNDFIVIGQDILEDAPPYTVWQEKGQVFKVVDFEHSIDKISLSATSEDSDLWLSEWIVDSLFLGLYFKKVQ